MKKTMTRSFRLIQGGKSGKFGAVRLLTHDDIKKFFATFAQAILVDQKRVARLSREDFSPDYGDGMWRRNREDHVEALVKLYMTVDKMPKRLLKELTAFALNHKSRIVKQPLLNALSDLATGVSSPELYETATLFFGQLMSDVSGHCKATVFQSNATEMIMEWFDYDDPLEIAEDEECDYVDVLAAFIKSEPDKKKRALAKRSKTAFAKMVFVKENFNKVMLACGIYLDEEQ